MTIAMRFLIGRIVIGLVGVFFIVTGLIKLEALADFRANITAYRFIPSPWVDTIAIFLPWWEVVAGGAALSRLWLMPAAVLIATLLVVFIGALSIALYMGITVPSCGCLGKISSELGIRSVIIDIALLSTVLISMILIFPQARENWQARGSSGN